MKQETVINIAIDSFFGWKICRACNIGISCEVMEGRHSVMPVKANRGFSRNEFY